MQKHWTITALTLAVLVIFFAAGCTKSKISSEPATMSTAEEEAARKAEEEARQRELARQKALAEENLKEESIDATMISEREQAAKTQFENEDLYFEFDSIQLTPEAQQILTKKGKWLRENPAAKVTIEGHCDNRGTNEYNLALGEGRAQKRQNFSDGSGNRHLKTEHHQLWRGAPYRPPANRKCLGKKQTGPLCY